MTERRYGQTMFLPEGDPETVDIPESDYPYGGMIGTKITLNRPVRDPATGTIAGHEKQYQLVRTDSNMTVTPFRGAVAWWQETASHTVTTDPTALGRGAVAGVFTIANTVGNLTLIQKKGPVDNVKFIDAVTAAPTTARLHVIPSSVAGKADCLASGTAPTFPLMGVSIGAYDAPLAEAAVELNIEDGVL